LEVVALTAMSIIPAVAGHGSASVPGDADVAALRRVRTGVRAVLALGITASLGANIAHAEPSVIGRLISGWSPVALALAVELVSRVPLTRSWRSVIRWTATAVIAGIAAWVSYWHMVSVAERHGESTTSAHLLPLSVDGLVVVASVCLVEITDRLRAVARLAAGPSPDQAPEAVAAEASSPPASPSGSPRASSRSSSAASSRGSSGRSSRSSSRGPGKARPTADDATLRALVAQARAERPGAGEPAVRRLLADAGLSASSARLRAALTAVPPAPPVASEGQGEGTADGVAA
jgi:hypothetical protein